MRAITLAAFWLLGRSAVRVVEGETSRTDGSAALFVAVFVLALFVAGAGVVRHVWVLVEGLGEEARERCFVRWMLKRL